MLSMALHKKKKAVSENYPKGSQDWTKTLNQCYEYIKRTKRNHV